MAALPGYFSIECWSRVYFLDAKGTQTEKQVANVLSASTTSPFFLSHFPISLSLSLSLSRLLFVCRLIVSTFVSVVHVRTCINKLNLFPQISCPVHGTQLHLFLLGDFSEKGLRHNGEIANIRLIPGQVALYQNLKRKKLEFFGTFLEICFLYQK